MYTFLPSEKLKYDDLESEVKQNYQDEKPIKLKLSGYHNLPNKIDPCIWCSSNA